MLNITQVERETGLSKDVLRVWERRYGFPVPQRPDGGDRVYDLEQVERLRLIKRLMDQGHRPGKLLSMPAAQMAGLAVPAAAASPVLAADSQLQAVMDCVLSNDSAGLRKAMSQLLARQGLQRFVQDMLPSLNEMVGSLWAGGQLDIYQEHLYSEEVGRLLRTSIGNLPPTLSRPHVLLTTVSGEEHGLGLLMVEGVLAPEGVHCLSLGVQTPIEDIIHATNAHQVDVLVLSFSVAYSQRHAFAVLRLLRERLPASLEIWAGGGMTRSIRRQKIDGVHWTPELRGCLERLEDWRNRHPA